MLLMRKNRRHFTGPHFRAKKGHADVAKVLIQNGANVMLLMQRETDALHYTAEENVVVAKVLIQSGTDVTF